MKEIKEKEKEIGKCYVYLRKLLIENEVFWYIELYKEKENFMIKVVDFIVVEWFGKKFRKWKGFIF